MPKFLNTREVKDRKALIKKNFEQMDIKAGMSSYAHERVLKMQRQQIDVLQAEVTRLEQERELHRE